VEEKVMNRLKIPFLSLLLILIMLTGCTKTGEDPTANSAPDTRILSYVIGSAAEVDTAGNPTTNYAVTVYWSGSDIDGEVSEYLYSSDGTTWTSTGNTKHDFVFDFATAAATYQVQVRAQDNSGAQDATPATVTITRDYGAVETSLLDGPPNGAVVGSAVRYKVATNTPTGTVTHIVFTVDDGSLLSGEVAVDTLGEALIDLNPLTGGAHIVYFAGKRDDGAVDETPVAVSLTARIGVFAPTIVNTSSVADGGGWFSGAGVTFSWIVVTDYYYGTVPTDAFSYSFDDATNFDLTSTPLASGWLADQSFAATGADMTAGDHTMYIKAVDDGGAYSILSILVHVAAFNPTQGILLIDDFSWTGGIYADEAAVDAAVDGGFMNGWTYTERNHDQPAAGPDDLASYSTVILYGDGGYNNQNNGALFGAYGSAGGNLLITGYELNDLAPTFASYGIYPAVFSTASGNWGGMDGFTGSAYESFNIDIAGAPGQFPTGRSYQRVYSDAANTEEIFHVRGVDGDTRACATRADMPNGNVVIVIGQSLPFMDQDAQATKDLGNYIIGTEFGETK
jgi:hypothetical protein